jgi:hypothetical protein
VRPGAKRNTGEKSIPAVSTWVRVSRIRNLDAVLRQFFRREVERFNTTIRTYIGQDEVKSQVVQFLPAALKGKPEIESAVMEKNFVFRGRPGTGICIFLTLLC